MKQFTFIAPILALMALACAKQEPETPAEQAPLVVEGWIESGKTPVVQVMTGIEASYEDRPVTDVVNNILRYAKVSIEHRGTTYPLTARLSDEYFLQNYFTTGRLVGEVGESYTLKVEWNGRKATSTCTIPDPEELIAVWSVPMVGDSLFSVRARFHNDKSRDRYYRIFTYDTNLDRTYGPAYLGSVNGTLYDEYIEEGADRGIHMNNMKSILFYRKGDVVKVKLATMEKPVFDFWSTYEQNFLCAVLTFPTFYGNNNGNVDGAIGYWAGYGITEQTLVI